MHRQEDLSQFGSAAAAEGADPSGAVRAQLSRADTAERAQAGDGHAATVRPAHAAAAYRRDIDGLRAVAVLLVLLFHFHIKLFDGGYVGVDIFFVISGFLITQIIFSDLKAGRFSIVTFYERRIRRIFPALLAMLAVTTAVAFALLLPSEVEDYGRSLVAASLSVSNIYFWTLSGYFAAPSLLKPLLHTWSLGVEEQFYLLFPLLLATVYRRRPKFVPLAVGLIALASFSAAVLVTRVDPSTAFFMPHLRAWELLIGGGLAVNVLPPLTKGWQREVASALGLALIAYAVFSYSDSTAFPGFAALMPCVGAALILAAGQHGTSFVGRLLSLKPLVWVGLISYSLYLWHWPVLVFQNSNALVVSGLSVRTTKLVLLAICLLLAWLSWRFVERPFRSGSIISRPMAFKAALAGTLATIAVGSVAVAADGFPSRFKPEALRVAAFLNYKDAVPNPHKCFIERPARFEDFDRSACLNINANRANYLLLGDSHANHLWQGMTKNLDVNVLQANAAGCIPTLDQHPGASLECSRMMRYMFSEFLQSARVDKLIIAAYWKASDLPLLVSTLQWARQKGIEAVVIGPIVVYDMPLPRILAAAVQSGDPLTIDKHRIKAVEELDSTMQAAVTAEGASYVSIYRQICTAEGCRVYAKPAVPMLFDYGHLTSEGSEWLISELQRKGQLP